MGPLRHCIVLGLFLICLYGSNGKQKHCYKYLCFCEGTTVNCSNNQRLLTYVPVPRIANITRYYFEFNYLPEITTDTFKNIGKYPIQFLSLKGNQVTTISRKAFHSLTRLETLHLSDNMVDPSYLQKAFTNIKQVRFLYLNNMGLAHLPNDFFRGLIAGKIEQIHLASNNLTNFNQSIEDYKQLTMLNLTANEISSLDLMPSASLGNLLLGSNRLMEIPDLCPNGTSLYPRLYELNLVENNISMLNVSDISCLDFIQVLSLSRNRIKYIPWHAFLGMRHLATLDITENGLKYLDIHKNSLNGSSISNLNLSSSSPWFSSSSEFFNCPNLKNLDMSNTNIPSYITNVLYKKLNLELFHCRNCSLHNIPVPLKLMTNLRYLFLEDNFITVIPDHVFDGNFHLSHLSLSRNNITSVTGFDISFSVRYNLEYISLEYNPFICDCRLLWFKKWIDDDKLLFSHQFMNYKCAKPAEVTGLQILDVGIVSDKRCLAQSPFTYVVCLVGAALVFLLLIALAYKCRYRICFCFIRRRPQYQSETRPLLQNDAYVVYCEENYHPWIRKELMPNMEDQRCLRLGIRQRDFDQSRHKVSNIVESLRCCRKVLVVLSNSFFRDSESQDELSLVLKCIEDHRGVLVGVLLEKIDDRYMSRPLYRLLQKITQLQWPLEPARRRQFWEDLKTSLNDTMLHSFT